LREKKNSGMPGWARVLVTVALSLTLACMVAVVSAVAVFHWSDSPPPLSAGSGTADGISLVSPNLARIEVRRGESARSVGNRLEAAGLIRGRYFWSALGRLRDDPIRAGTYLVEVPAAMSTIRAILETGRDELVRVTVPEGLTVRETALVMEAAGVTGAAAFAAAAGDPVAIARLGLPGPTMEGFLFPDTYLFPAGFPAERVAQAMVENFLARAAVIDPSIPDLPADELLRLVTLASIVEKEYRVPEEAPVMAGVFLNRVNRVPPMRLESCATVVYVIVEKEGIDFWGRPEFPGRLMFRDIDRTAASPFNTYRNDGLPPAPIASPGTIALRAAFAPEESDYLFFRLRYENTGHHTFSRTLAEHNAAERYFRRVR